MHRHQLTNPHFVRGMSQMEKQAFIGLALGAGRALATGAKWGAQGINAARKGLGFKVTPGMSVGKHIKRPVNRAWNTAQFGTMALPSQSVVP